VKIDTPTLLTLLGIIGGIVFTYGQLTNKVQSLEYLKELSDQNMNRVIVLETKAEAAQIAFDLYMGAQ
jgi:hypothetical protein